MLRLAIYLLQALDLVGYLVSYNIMNLYRYRNTQLVAI